MSATTKAKVREVEQPKKVKRGFARTCQMIGRRLAKQEELSFGEKAIFLFCAVVWWTHLQIQKVKVWVKTTNWEKVGNEVSLIVTGITIPFWVWFIWSYINVITNNVSSPELISEYNMFVVFLNIFG